MALQALYWLDAIIISGVGMGTRNPQYQNGFKASLFFIYCQIFAIFDDFSKFHRSVFIALHFEKQWMQVNLALIDARIYSKTASIWVVWTGPISLRHISYL